MYPVRTKGRRFLRHRWFNTGDWLVYYRVVDNIVYIRGLGLPASLDSQIRMEAR